MGRPNPKLGGLGFSFWRPSASSGRAGAAQFYILARRACVRAKIFDKFSVNWPGIGRVGL